LGPPCGTIQPQDLPVLLTGVSPG
jgi:two-component system, chemotaxis family, chemotaxis protein CheY